MLLGIPHDFFVFVFLPSAGGMWCLWFLCFAGFPLFARFPAAGGWRIRGSFGRRGGRWRCRRVLLVLRLRRVGERRRRRRRRRCCCCRSCFSFTPFRNGVGFVGQRLASSRTAHLHNGSSNNHHNEKQTKVRRAGLWAWFHNPHTGSRTLDDGRGGVCVVAASAPIPPHRATWCACWRRHRPAPHPTARLCTAPRTAG